MTKLIINEDNEVIEYCVVGDIEDSIEYDGVLPDDFREKFKPSFYLLKDGEIVENPNYVEPSINVPTGPTGQDKAMANLTLELARNKASQDRFNSQLLLQMAKLGGDK